MNLIAVFIAWICLIHASQANPFSSFLKQRQCDCLNLAYIDRPTDIRQCNSKTRYVNQVNQNFNTVRINLSVPNKNKKCDFSKYHIHVNEMHARTLAVVDAYFSCTENNCTSTIMTAYSKFAEYRSKVFNVYTKCSFTTYTPDCAQILIQARPPVYASAENVLVGLLACSQLKADALLIEGSDHTQYKFSASDLFDIVWTGARDCNCIKIDKRPIPQDETECYSNGFISNLRNFVLVNVNRVQAAYTSNKRSHPECTYDTLEKEIRDLKEFALELPDLLQEDSPKFVDIDEYIQRYIALLIPYGPDVRNYILDNSKTCYFPVRQSRITLLSIIDAVIGVVTKCVGYRDRLDQRC
ncbi:uncharacterized protein LOC119067219 isoform X2 [Bradysia coprophila]|uniref:uncharacterized protein LOC119067219 isoform X2 n=1 Tax=Bradysia coprophila TaxID=38358 RepID=UPI00187DADD3|nr:uncharacterized protein LOC119067219 isoform X2 [Bradysia coprophila]